MPARKQDQPRKSDALLAEDSALSTAAPANESQVSAAAAAPDKTTKDKDKDKEKERERDTITIEDLTLPKSIITRLAKGVLPPNTQIQANAILAMCKSATVFINYLASHANENTVNANKKTVSPADVFKALDDVEFSFLKEALEAEFAKFNQIQTEKRTNYRQKARAKHDGAGGDDAEMADTTAASEMGGGAPRAKKARVDPGEGDEEEDDDDDDEDAETEEDEAGVNEEGDDDERAGEEEEEEEEDEEAQDGTGSSEETQDALEEKTVGEDRDEALDGDESD